MANDDSDPSSTLSYTRFTADDVLHELTLRYTRKYPYYKALLEYKRKKKMQQKSVISKIHSHNENSADNRRNEWKRAVENCNHTQGEATEGRVKICF